jgi:hypothetical protein
LDLCYDKREEIERDRLREKRRVRNRAEHTDKYEYEYEYDVPEGVRYSQSEASIVRYWLRPSNESLVEDTVHTDRDTYTVHI